MKKTLFILTALLLAAVPALAHDMWLTLDNPQEGAPLKVLVGYGHAFPASEGTEAESLTPAVITGARGTMETKAGEGLSFVSQEPMSKGTYVVTSARKAQFYTKSPSGSSSETKDKVPEAISCVRSAKYAKAILNLGGEAGDVSQPVGQTLEIVPLANPSSLKTGDDLPILVLFNGEPLKGAEIYGVWEGFSTHKGSYAFAAKSDKEGKAFVKLWHSGLWLVLAKHKIPFSDPAKCDNESHSAALTFVLK